jgi:hypothetical protein
MNSKLATKILLSVINSKDANNHANTVHWYKLKENHKNDCQTGLSMYKPHVLDTYLQAQKYLQ